VSAIARGIFVVTVLAVGIAFGAYYAWPNAIRDSGIDYRVFWRAASEHDVYQPGHMPFAYPPTALVLLKPISLLSAAAGYWFWIIASALFFAIVVAKLAGWRIAALSFLSPAAIKGLILGQSAMLLAGAAFAALLLPQFAGGLILGMLLVIKPQLFLLAPLAFVVRREWRVLSGMAVGGLALVVASIAMFGFDLWADWLAALPSFRETLIRDGVLDRVVTPAGRAEFAGLPAWPFLLAGFAIGGAAIYAAAAQLKGAQLAALIVAASLVASPYAHVHDTIALIPAALILIMHGPWWAAVASAVIFSGAPGLTMVALMAILAGVAAKSLKNSRSISISAERSQAPDA
jgi:hypothetical protein